MAEARPEQSRGGSVLTWLAFAPLGGALVAVSAVPLLGPVGTDVTNSEIRFTALLPVCLWCLAWPLAFVRTPIDLVPRFIWALGCALLLVHIAVAFHLGHGWTHAKAWEHTREAGGYGDGVFVNYAFALVWLFDAMWALVAFKSYCERPRWLNWTIHGFLAFVVFNAAFVFASWKTRGTFLFMFLLALAPVVQAKWFRPVDAARVD